VDQNLAREECPACGGAGGGPFGRAGSGWDVETYECPRCQGSGYVSVVAESAGRAPSVRPGIVKATPATRVDEKKRKTGA
jgi:hypothetical protein